VLLSGAEEPEVAAPLALGVGAVALVPFGVLWWDVEAGAWPWIGASVAFELGYIVLLARAYARADLGFVYPVARGSAPVLVLVAGVVAFGFSPSAAEVLGVLLVVAGIVLVRGVAGTGDVALALAVGACIAGYTLVDDRGLEHAAPVPYLMCVLVPTAALSLAVRGSAARASIDLRVAAAGAGMAGAYLLTLAALELAAAAPVAAVRETSVLLAVAVAAWLGRERLTPARLAGAALVVAGIAALAA
jgi:drug/metabolite transporter (DMT)-like permease